MTIQEAKAIDAKVNELIKARVAVHKAIVETEQVDFILDNPDFFKIRQDLKDQKAVIMAEIAALPRIPMNVFLAMRAI